MSFEDPTCTGWSVTDNKLYGSNGYLYEGDSAPALAHNNRFFPAATTPDAATTPEVASIYDWQKANATTARLVLVIDRRTVTETGGTTSGSVVRVKASTDSDFTVNLQADIAGVIVPATVTIPAGAVRADFTITGSAVSGGEKLVTLTASAAGLLSDGEKVALLDQDVAQPNFGGHKWPVYPAGLPANWKAANYGQVTVAGTQTYTPGTDTWAITGGGGARRRAGPAPRVALRRSCTIYAGSRGAAVCTGSGDSSKTCKGSSAGPQTPAMQRAKTSGARRRPVARSP